MTRPGRTALTRAAVFTRSSSFIDDRGVGGLADAGAGIPWTGSEASILESSCWLCLDLLSEFGDPGFPGGQLLLKRFLMKNRTVRRELEEINIGKNLDQVLKLVVSEQFREPGLGREFLVGLCSPGWPELPGQWHSVSTGRVRPVGRGARCRVGFGWTDRDRAARPQYGQAFSIRTRRRAERPGLRRARSKARSDPARSMVRVRGLVEVERATGPWLGSPDTSTGRPFREELCQWHDRIDVRRHGESLDSGVGAPSLKRL